MFKNIVLVIFSILLSVFISACSSTQPTIEIGENAIQGYDPVSYYISGRSNKGDVAYQYTYKNSAWSFQNEENLERFKADPEKFLPLYNGFCAYEISEGRVVESDPKVWHIYNKKLYLFSDERSRQLWFRDITQMIDKAQKEWMKLTLPTVVPIVAQSDVSTEEKTVTPVNAAVAVAPAQKTIVAKPENIAVETPQSTVMDLEETVVEMPQKPKAKTITQMRDIALEGYDPVAYFNSGESYMADGRFRYSYNKTEWFFKSESNLEKFKASPEAYIPVYSGFCAYELAYGNLVQTNPRIWHIYNKKLYLFSNESAKELWYQNISMMIQKSDNAWKRMTP